MPDEATLTFASEDERAAALAEIPTMPPKGTADRDAWEREMDEKQNAILGAPITAPDSQQTEPSQQVSEEPRQPTATEPTPTQVPTPEPTVQAPPADQVSDDFFDFTVLGNQGKVRRDELPEELRSYKDVNEVVKQFAHARRYANDAEQKVRDMELRIQQAQADAQRASELQAEIDRLKTVQHQVPQTPTQQVQTVAQIDTLQKTLDKIKNIDESDMVTGDVFKETFATLAEEIAASNSAPVTPAVPQSYIDDLNALKTELKNYKTQDEQKRLEDEETRNRNAALQEIRDLQERHPELNTTKPLTGMNSVESSIVRFCDRVYGERIPDGDWHIRNLIVNGVITKDPDIVSASSKAGVSLGDYGINENDVKAYARVLDVDRKMRGERIDPLTGQIVPNVNKLGKTVSYESYEDAYNKILDDLGIRQKEQANALKNAEIESQKNLQAQLDRRDTSPEILGNAGSTDSKDLGQEMTMETALEILGMDDEGNVKPGSNTIDQLKMEKALRSGDPRGWDVLEILNRAKQRVGLPPDLPDPGWIKPPTAQK